jgi:hypothetical protein
MFLIYLGFLEMSSKFAVSILIFAIVCTCIAGFNNNKLSNATKILNFLQSIPASSRTEMDTILKNNSLTKGEIETKLDSWAAKQPGDFPVSFTKSLNL